MIDDHGWVEYALCAGDEPDSLFVQGAAQRQVRMRCMECPVRLECLADALQSQMSYGVWGGLTERERRVILRVYPERTDWSEWLMHSRDPLAVELRKPRVPQSLYKCQGITRGITFCCCAWLIAASAVGWRYDYMGICNNSASNSRNEGNPRPVGSRWLGARPSCSRTDWFR